MRIILRPDSDHLITTGENLSLLEGFFKSLGLTDTKNWRQFQHCYLGRRRSHIEIFGMPVKIPMDLLIEQEWQFGIDECSPGVCVLSINKTALAARMPPAACYSQIASVPRNILCLIWDGYIHTDAPPLGGFLQLTALSLANCYRLKDLSLVSELPTLTALEILGCQPLKNLGPLSQLTELRELALVFSKYITDLSPLSGLQQLSYLDLRMNATLEDLSPLATLINLEFLKLAGCNAIESCQALKNLPNLKALDLKTPFLAGLDRPMICE